MTSPNRSEQSLNIFITGGAGFIGSHLVDILLASQHRVCVYDNLTYGKKDFLKLNHENLVFIKGDIVDSGKLHTAATEFDAEIVYHLAAIHHIPTCELNPVAALRANIEGTQNVLTVSAELPHIKRVILASSGAVYDTVDESLMEDRTKTMPYDIYSVTKLSDEHLLRLATRKSSFDGVVARIFNCIGARETNAHLVPDILEQVKSGKVYISLGNLTPKRSYIHVKDTAEGLFALLDVPVQDNYDVFNIGTKTEHSVTDIISTLSEIMGRQFTPVSIAEKTRKVDRHRQLANLTKVSSVAHWEPKRSLKEALEDAVRDAGL